MASNKKHIRALGLCSGGLDSMLSALVLRKQGIAVEWITFETPFFSSEKALKAGQMNDIPVMVKKITPIYMEMLKNPPAGFGKYMNPCADCHALMFNRAGKVMDEKGYDFLFSGEVLGQRPMSQTRSRLRYVEKHSGYEGRILRPLSAKRLPETLPEKKGLVRRELLLDITGRSRKRQIALAKEFGLPSYPAPAGGCLLTSRGYATRLKDLVAYSNNPGERELFLLKFGRHIRVDDRFKIIVGRSKADNEKIIQYFNPDSDVLIESFQVPAPTVLIPNQWNYQIIELAARIGAGYSKAAAGREIPVMVISPHHYEVIRIVGIPPADIRHLMIK